jgi:hypothetical protein
MVRAAKAAVVVVIAGGGGRHRGFSHLLLSCGFLLELPGRAELGWRRQMRWRESPETEEGAAGTPELVAVRIRARMWDRGFGCRG